MTSSKNPFKRSTQQPLLSLQKISQAYNNEPEVLKQVSFHLMPGEMVYITGESGAGKTTLLKICALFLKPSHGSLVFNRQNTQGLSFKKSLDLRRSISFINQKPIFIQDETISQNLALPLKVLGFCKEEIDWRVTALLEKINLYSSANAYPHQLSAGEQECLNIARGLITHPTLIIADEPLGHGDHRTVQLMMDLLLQANKFGVTLLIATHDLSQIARSKSRALFLKDGQFINEEVLTTC